MKNIAEKNEIILLQSPSNLFYFTGLNNPDAYLLFIDASIYYFTDNRYMEDAQKKLKDVMLENISGFFSFIKQHSIDKIGIEPDLPYFLSEKLKGNGVSHFYDVSSRITDLRSRKSEIEIETIQNAQKITDRTFDKILGKLREGMTERELASELESTLFTFGADDLAFRSIIAFDENTSIPHAERSDKKLKNGSIITLDFGAKYKNYCSDMTRTFFFGGATDEQKKIYEEVLSAQKKAIDSIAIGMPANECDKIARNIFESHRLAQYFLHSLGHGVGLDIHEHPYLSPHSGEIIRENNVVTVEPGLYFADKFGIRIEDMIYFHKTGVINLTKSPKNMIIV